jgi:hypothetical protein
MRLPETLCSGKVQALFSRRGKSLGLGVAIPSLRLCICIQFHGPAKIRVERAADKR